MEKRKPKTISPMFMIGIFRVLGIKFMHVKMEQWGMLLTSWINFYHHTFQLQLR